MKRMINGIQTVQRKTLTGEEIQSYIVWWNRHIELFTDDETVAEARLEALLTGGDPDEVADKQLRGEL